MPLNPIDGTTDPDERIGTVKGDHIRGFEGDDTLYGNDGKDLIEGGADNDRIYGGYGDDRVFGGDGNDAIEGSYGRDRLFGGAGDDSFLTFFSDGADSVYGGDGNDYLYWSSESDGIFHGGRGLDHLAYFNVYSANAVTVDISSGSGTLVSGETTLQLTSVERLTIYGGQAGDDLTGGRFADALWAYGGANTVDGGAGNDRILYNTGEENVLEGGTGNDLLMANSANAGAVHLVVSGDGIDDGYGSQISGFERFMLRGGAFNDTLEGDDGHDTIYGDRAQDVLEGNDGNDQLHGQAGEDFISGGAGDDTVNGGAGFDTMYGGSGADAFVFARNDGALDLIMDFESGADTLQFSVAAYGIPLGAGTPVILSYDGYSGNDPQFVYDTTNGVLLFAPQGAASGSWFAPLVLSGAPTLVAADIVLF